MNSLKQFVKTVVARTPVAKDLLRLKGLEREVLQYKNEILQYKRQLNLIGDQCTTYEEYADALKEVVSKEGYNNSDLSAYIAKKTNAWLTETVSGPWRLGSDVLQTLFSALLVSTSRGSLRVMDFGGGCAVPAAILRDLTGPKFRFSWSVVELPTLVNAVDEAGFTHAKWHADIKTAVNDLGGIDLIHTSGTLQYLENPVGHLLSLNTEYVFFGRLAFHCGDRNVIGIQRSPIKDHGVQMPGDATEGYVEYPFTYMPLDDFEHILADAEYELVLDFAENSGMRPINDFKIVGGARLYRKR